MNPKLSVLPRISKLPSSEGAFRQKTWLAGIELEAINTDFKLKLLQTTYKPFNSFVICQVDGPHWLGSPPSQLARVQHSASSTTFPVAWWPIVLINKDFDGGPKPFTKSTHQNFIHDARRFPPVNEISKSFCL
uniref:Uncharacterized protein n=1 Tax=Micromonas pusilla TaxID=38833 RepID=A0A6U0GJV2_MICPS